MRYLEGLSWTSEEDVCDNWHPYSFTARLSGKDEDNPTYNDILRGSSTERALWEDAMVKELKSLGNLGSFKMIKLPGGAKTAKIRECPAGPCHTGHNRLYNDVHWEGGTVMAAGMCWHR